jgi:C-terminal processing protease CtpA/Prc
MKRKIQMVLSLMLLAGCMAGCSFPMNLFQSEETEVIPTPAPTPLLYKQMGVLQVQGSVYDSPDSYYENYSRPFVLYDLTGLMRENVNWLMNPEDMVIAHVDTLGGKNIYTLNLPAIPNGMLHDTYHNGVAGDGVQIFTYWWGKDLWLSDYIEETEQYKGWPIYDLAITFDETGTQIKSGWLLVWAQDNQQMFPVHVGDDGVLFTEDDVMQPILPGYTSVYLEDGTLTWDRSEKIKVSILAPYDVRQYDLSHKSPLEAYDQAAKLLEGTYQNWDEEVDSTEFDYIHNELREELIDAIDEESIEKENAVFGKFVSIFDSSVVSLTSTDDIEMIKEAYPSDFGFTTETFSDGTVRITDMRMNSPTYSTNLDYGYIILEVDGKPVDEALAETPVLFFPNGEKEATRRLQEIFLFRKPEDAKMKIKVLDLQGEEETLTLTSTADTEFLDQTLPSFLREYQKYEAPVVAETIESVGVISVYDIDRDPSLTLDMFERALISFQQDGIDDFIIDLRGVGGDTFLHLAGFFNNSVAPIDLGTYSCADNHTWNLYVKGKERKFSYDSIGVLIDSGCRGACEFEALAFSKTARTKLYGHTPTNGAFNIDFQAKIKLPNDLQLEFPYCNIESVKLPVDQESYNVVPDVLLGKSFYEALEGPSYLVNQVVYEILKDDYRVYSREKFEALTINELIYYYQDAVYINTTIIEDESTILYYHDQPSFDFHVPVYRETDSKGAFDYSICMDSYGELMPVVNVVSPTFYLDSNEIESSRIYESSYLSDYNQNCYFWLFGIKTFPPGVHEITMKLTIEEPVIFHESLWEPGDYEFHYNFIFSPK